MNFIEIKNLTKIYEMGNKKIYAVNNVNLTVNKEEFIILFGPSGSGKTTLLLLLGGLIKPTSGSIIVEGQDITKLRVSALVRWRQKNVGFIFQKINLIDFLDVYDNVIVPIVPFKINLNDSKKKAHELIERVGLKERTSHRPSQLSVGEQQRVAIARALITEPKIVLADEPTAHLDTETGKKIVKLMKELQKRFKSTFIVSTHDPELLNLADRIVKMRDGKVITDA
ncbi:MAG: ABC transporter ATP-binding protein [Candidatus Odinarchaeota archaeon]|nr:ABC transporter ATP-binding protein [Candidatus Odinarchaeota archaeon]